jgi:hypothetical protein
MTSSADVTLVLVIAVVHTMAGTIFNSSNLIDAVQNEDILWNTNSNATEEEKELTWQRVADVFGMTNGKYNQIIRPCERCTLCMFMITIFLT